MTIALAFALGVACLQWQPALPSPTLLGFMAVTASLLCLAAWRLPQNRTALLAGAALMGGFCWAGWLATQRLADSLPAELEGRDLLVTGVIASLPEPFDHGLRFTFQVEQADVPLPRRLLLSWYHDRRLPVPDLVAGERWRLTVRLKRPHGAVNPQGFDYEAWLLERNIGATGYVRALNGATRMEDFVWHPLRLIERWRQQIRARFAERLAGAEYGGVLSALAIGDQRAIAPEHWRLFAYSGITHLMSISGLHVTMIGVLAGLTFGALWRRLPRLPLLWPAQRVRALAGLLAAGGYTLISGAGIPAQRTFFMLAIAALAVLTAREIAAHRLLAGALLAVLLLDPWAVLAPGFWLSFGCVALLFYITAGQLSAEHWLRAWWRAQWAVTVGMIPALLALFGAFSLISPLANALAIPLISLIVTPLALLAIVPPLDHLLIPAHWLTEQLLTLLAWLSAQPWALWRQAVPPSWAVALGIAGALWWLLPRGLPARWLGGVLMLPLFLLPPDRPPEGQARITVLDVGQGLAVHLQTARHDLLFDAGPASDEQSGAGPRIVLPFLYAQGVRTLDALVLSHADRDHSGGAQALVENLPITRLIGALPFEDPLSALPLPWQPCIAGEHWRWDGVDFLWLHPPAGREVEPQRGNATSCVLRISTGDHAVLLTADISQREEAELIARHGPLLASDVLVAPHHGGAGSSSPAFVSAVGAREAIFSAGYRNRFGHPRPEVLERYTANGARLWRTDRDGAVTLSLSAQGVIPTAERQRAPRYWRRPAATGRISEK